MVLYEPACVCKTYPYSSELLDKKNINYSSAQLGFRSPCGTGVSWAGLESLVSDSSLLTERVALSPGYNNENSQTG